MMNLTHTSTTTTPVQPGVLGPGSKRSALEGIGPAQLQRLREYWVSQLHQCTAPESFSLGQAAAAMEWIQAIDAVGAAGSPGNSITKATLPVSLDAPADGSFFREFADDYLAYVKGNFSPKTLANAARVVKLLLAVWAERPLTSLTAEDLEKFKAKRGEDGVSRTTINIDVRTVKAMFGVAVQWKRIRENPFRKAKLLRIDEKTKYVLSPNEFVSLATAIREGWLMDITCFAALTGMRLGEIMNLRWSDYSAEHGEITVQSSTQYRVKGGKKRTIPLNSEASAILSRTERRSEWIFLGSRGRRVSAGYVSKLFKRYARKLGFPEEVHFHRLRDACFTWLAEQGVPLHVIQSLAGHSSLEVTEGYITSSTQAMKSGVERIHLPLSGLVVKSG